MSKCKNCNVEILDDSQICPLCHSVLEEGEEGHNTYPDAWIPTRRLKFVTNIIFFLVLLGSVAAGYLNYIWYQGKLWSLIAIAGLWYLFLIFRLDILSNNGYRTKIIATTLSGILYVILIHRRFQSRRLQIWEGEFIGSHHINIFFRI